MAFSVLVEMLNLRLRKTTEPVSLHGPIEDMRKTQAADRMEPAGDA
jgi:hypothetical protein